jgi:hypothetical protein
VTDSSQMEFTLGGSRRDDKGGIIVYPEFSSAHSRDREEILGFCQRPKSAVVPDLPQMS